MSDETIGRADYELRADRSGLKKDLADARSDIAASGKAAESETAARSSKWGAAVSAGAKIGVKTVATATAGMLAIASKGAFQLQGVMDRFQADTGASAEESRRAGKVINKVAGDNRVSLESVADAAAKVRTDLGAVGDEADDLTGKFTRYARVTKQDAGGAVTAFDDILDAWNLKASDSGAIMDKLVVSHQKFGGAVTADQAALAALAPTLRAANMTVDDGIALVDLFKASGVDATAAVTGLTSALGKVKSPEELQRLIADISATEDPLLRAQKAADLFGAKAGPKLANALAGKSLKDFAIDAGEAAGQTEKMNEVLDQSIPAQLQKKISQFGASLRGLGADWGPAITGAASFASVLGALGLDSVLSKVWKGAAASALVQKAAAFAGDKAATAYLQTLIAGDAVSTAMSGAWTRVSTSPKVTGAIDKAGDFMGTKLGKAFGVAFALVAVAEAVDTWFKTKAALDAQSAALLNQTESFVQTATQEQVDAALKSAKEQMVQLLALRGGVMGMPGVGPIVAASTDDAVLNLQKTIDTLSAGSKAAGTAFIDGYTSVLAQGKPRIAAANGSLTEAARQTVWDVRQAILDGKASITAAWAQALDERNAAANAKDQIIINNAEIAAQKKILADKKATAAEKAQARITLRNLRASNVELEVEQSKYGTRTEQIAKTKALLTSKALLKGLKDKDPDIRAYWQKIKHDLEAQLGNLDGTGYTYGRGFTKGFIAGLVKDIDRVGANARTLARVVKKYLQVRSPSELGPFSEMGGPEGWGSHWMDLYSRGLTSGLGRVNAILGGVGRAGMPSLAAAAAAAYGGQGSTSSTVVHSGVNLSGATFHLHGIGSDVSPAAASRFGHQVLDEVAKGFREGRARLGGRA